MSSSKSRSSAVRTRAGFTLLEVLMAVAILAAVTGITFLSFSIVSNAWRRGIALSDDLHHGDFILEQLVMGLRSAYYRGMKPDEEFGFTIEDNGDDAYSSDRISWVKLGGSLVGRDAPYAGSPHRVEFYIDEDEDGRPTAAVRAWRLLGQSEDFDPDEVEPVFIARRVTGFNCRMQDPEYNSSDPSDIEWIDEWEDTNRVPKTVELTLWLEPLEEGEEPFELKRIVSIPLAPMSWGQKATLGGDSSPGGSSGPSSSPSDRANSGNSGSGSSSPPASPKVTPPSGGVRQ